MNIKNKCVNKQKEYFIETNKNKTQKKNKFPLKRGKTRVIKSSL